ncbi:MAG: metal-dependent hydrolase family protein [Mycobacteriales bacterium]
MTLLLFGGQLIDGSGNEPVAGAVVTVDGNRVRSIGSRARGKGESIDLSGLTVLPGLIDLHTHMGVVATEDATALSPAMTAALLFQNAELCLMSGHTTAREVAGADGALREVIDAGLIPGPRLFPSGPLLCQSGGHGDTGAPYYPSVLNHHHSGTPGLAQLSITCDGPDAVRIAARHAFRRGATQLKLCISGGVVSYTDRLEDTQFSLEEMRAAVEEAHARETYVTAHAHNSRAINAALDAGLECFEHGTFLDEPTVARMAEVGAALVPTLTVTHLLRSEWREWGVPESALPRLGGVEEAMMASLKLAYDAGVTVGSGTDLLGPRQNRRGLELALKATVIGPMAAIVSATSASARILRRPDLGLVAEGKLADLIAVNGDPLAEPELFDDPARIVLVVKDGKIVKDLRG